MYFNMFTFKCWNGKKDGINEIGQNMVPRQERKMYRKQW